MMMILKLISRMMIMTTKDELEKKIDSAKKEYEAAKAAVERASAYSQEKKKEYDKAAEAFGQADDLLDRAYVSKRAAHIDYLHLLGEKRKMENKSQVKNCTAGQILQAFNDCCEDSFKFPDQEEPPVVRLTMKSGVIVITPNTAASISFSDKNSIVTVTGKTYVGGAEIMGTLCFSVLDVVDVEFIHGHGV